MAKPAVNDGLNSAHRPTVPDGSCAHCHRPLPWGASEYCCAGCASARAIIEGLGLGRFDALGGAPGPVAVMRADEAVVDGLQARLQHSPPLCTLDVDVEGISCASCAWLVEKAAQKQPGVAHAVLNPALGRLSLSVDQAHFDAAGLVSLLGSLGHRVGTAGKKSDPVADDLLVRFGVSAALASAAMIFAFSFYFGLDEQDDGVIATIFSWGQLIAATLAVLIGGEPFFRGAWRSVVQRAPTMDIPIALGMLGALSTSLLSHFSLGRGSYFDTVAIFVTLMLLGRLLERRVVEQNRRLLLTHDQEVAGLQVRRLLPSGAIERVATRRLQTGDRLLLAPGELVPVDAVVAEGAQDHWLSLAWVNGEAEARAFAAGAGIPAGAHNVDTRPLQAVVTAPFDASRLATLLAPAPERGPDSFFVRISRAWVFGVLFLAVGAIAAWWSAGPPRALEVVTALLVVTCPCAFGIAAPLAIERATALLRARGVFVKSPTFLARARRVKKVLFDKTGTLTSGELILQNPEALRGLLDDERGWLATLVAGSNHPKSRALHAHLGHTPLAALSIIEVAGVGVRGQAGALSLALLRAGERDHNGDEALVFFVGDEPRARFHFREELRAGAANEVQRLRDLGIELWIASGDDEARVFALAQRLGIAADHVRGELSPEQKRDLVRSLDDNDTLFIGDGVNDAMAFSAAACCGTPAVDRPHLPARADFFLLGGDLSSIVDAIVLARHLRRVLVGLLSAATVYNAVTIALSLLGFMTPVMVALIMPASSLSLISAAAFLLRSPAPVSKEPGVALRLEGRTASP